MHKFPTFDKKGYTSLIVPKIHVFIFFIILEMDTNKNHIRHCILFMFNLGKKASQAKDEIYQAYGTGSVGLTTIKEWYAKFKKGEFNL